MFLGLWPEHKEKSSKVVVFSVSFGLNFEDEGEVLILKWKIHLSRTDQNKTQILWKEIRFRRFRIRENMWWTRYSMWFSPPLTLLMNPTCLLWLKKTKIPRPLDWDRPRIIPLPAPPPSRPHTTTPDPNNCEQSTKLPVKTRKLTATSIRFLSHIWRNCRFVKLCT